MKALAYFFLFLGHFSFSTVIAQDIAQAGAAKVKFETLSHDFGDISQGDVVKTTFVLTNEGGSALIINNVATTCGCTAPIWPRQPIEPGKKAEIVVQFDSRGKMGIQNKIVTIYSNSETPQVRLRISANVLPKE